MKRALVVILNWNGKELLSKCLDSLHPELNKRDNVLVVDNGSTDGSPALLRKNFSWVRRLELPKNLGFTGGNNAALQFVDEYEYFILLNNDIEVEPGFVDELLALFRRPKVGLSNAVILDAPGERVDHAGGKWLSFLSGTNVGAYRGADPRQVPSAPFPTTYASGAAVAVPTELLKRYGLFPDFFAYYEDVDLSWRIQRAGYQILVAPKARVRHLGSATSGRHKPLFEWYAARNRIYLFRRNLRWWQKPIVLPTLILARLLLLLPSITQPEILKARLGGLLAGIFTPAPHVMTNGRIHE